VFVSDWRERIIGTDLQQIWLDHLLVLSMLQHPSKRWTWGRFVLVFPADNPSFVSAAARYGALLTDTATFSANTIEALLAVPTALNTECVSAFCARYMGEVLCAEPQ
jgi:hypothetical protein